MPADDSEVREFLADCNLRRHGWDGFQRGARRSAARLLSKLVQEPSEPHADPNRPA